MNIVLRYTLNVDDVHELNRAHFRLQKRSFRVRWILVALVGITALFPIVLGVLGARTWADVREFVSSPYPLAALFFCLSYSAILIRARFSKALAKEAFRKEPRLAEPIETTITATSVTRRSPNSMMSMEWNLFSRFYESAGVFLLFTDAGSAQVIPKRAFASQADMDEFRAFAKGHIGVQSLGFPVEGAPAPARTGSLN